MAEVPMEVQDKRSENMETGPFMACYLPKMNKLVIGCQDPMEDTKSDQCQKLAVA